LGRLDALRRFFLEGMDHPDIAAKLHRVDNAEGISLERQRDLQYTEPRPCSGFAISALPPSAAIDSAVRQMDWAPSGNFSNSFSAALLQETGWVLRTSAVRYRVPSIYPKMLSSLTTARQASLSLEEKFFVYENWNEAALHDTTRGGAFHHASGAGHAD
jgi:hypothetical protein